MQPRIILSVIVALCTLAGTAHAAEKIVIWPVALAPNASIGENIKRECGLEGAVAKQVFQRVSERFPGVEQNQLPSQNDGETLVLKVTILSVAGLGGGPWSGAKSMTIQADVLRNGTIGASHGLSRSSTGGAFGAMSGTCAIMDRIAVALGRDVAAWLPTALAAVSKTPVSEPAADQAKP